MRPTKFAQRSDAGVLQFPAWLLEEQRKGKRACSMMGSVG